jgi:hypothetical protein
MMKKIMISCPHCKKEIIVHANDFVMVETKQGEKNEGRTMNEEEINKKIEEKNKEIDELRKQQEENKIKDGKAYNCRECGTTTDISGYDQDKDWTREKLCYSCFKKKKYENLKKDTINKLIGARITDADVRGNQIYGLTIYNQGMTHELEPKVAGDEDGYMEIDDSYRQKDVPLFDDEVKPFQKQRKEKRLP